MFYMYYVEQWLAILWQEGSVSVVKPTDVTLSGQIMKGTSCSIMEGKQLQSGTVIGFGKNDVQNNNNNK